MSLSIEAVGVSTSGLPLLRKGSTTMMVKAARQAIKRAGVDVKDIRLIIDSGLYRDENIGEPALASFIQGELGINPLYNDGKSTFSFDILNGGIGVLTATHVASTFLRSQGEYALITTGDAEPARGYSESFPYKPIGAAMLMGHSKGPDGFQEFRFDTYPEHAGLFTGDVDFIADSGRNMLRIREGPGYLEACVSSTARSMDRSGLSIGDFDLVIPSQSPIGYPSAIARELSIPPGSVVDVTGKYGNIHTAGIAAAIDETISDGRFGSAKNVLFLAVGSGLNVALATYRGR